MENETNLSFSQRNGFSSIPQQLKLGDIPAQFTALVWGAMYNDFEKEVSTFGTPGRTRLSLGQRWKRIIYDYSVEVFHELNPGEISYYVPECRKIIENAIKSEAVFQVMDSIEYFLSHPSILPETKKSIISAFPRSHLAYRVVDSRSIIAIGTAEQGAAVEQALEMAVEIAPGASSHLKAAGSALARNDWAVSVRESITAVEAAAKLLAGEGATLGDALKALGKSYTLNPMLKSAFEKLYAYTNSEGGIRHANVFADKANVDEDDALFMLGASASFVTFLLSKMASVRASS